MTGYFAGLEWSDAWNDGVGFYDRLIDNFFDPVIEDGNSYTLPTDTH